MKKAIPSSRNYKEDIIGMLILILGTSVFFGLTIFEEAETNSSLWWILLIVGIELVGLYFLIKRFLRNAFKLHFTEEEVLVKYTFLSRDLKLSYSQLISVQHSRPYRAHPNEIFVFGSENGRIRLRTNPIGSDDDFFHFIFWLKKKNPNFKTYVSPESDLGAKLYEAFHPEQFPK